MRGGRLPHGCVPVTSFQVRFVSVSPSLRGLPANGGSYFLQRAPYAGKLAHRLGPRFQPPVFQALGGSTTGRGPQYREAWPVVPRAVLRGTAGHGPRHFPRTRPITFPCPSPNYPLHLHQTNGLAGTERQCRTSRQSFGRGLAFQPSPANCHLSCTLI